MLGYVASFATPVSQEDAAVICHNFLLQKQLKNHNLPSSFQYYKTETFDGTAVYHIFRFEPTGFMAVSASNHFEPILCYSFESDYLHNPAFDFAMDIYARWISYCEKNEVDFDGNVAGKWQKWNCENFTPAPVRAVVVEPLISTLWNQDLYFNTYCPWDIHASWGCDGHVYTGCVATAMSQVMNYHGHPYSGLAGTSYIPQPYDRITIRFSEQTYNYNAMPNRPDGYANEMAKLIFHCGVAVQMGYTTQGSGAHSVTAMDAMKNNFKYDHASLCARGLFELDSITPWLNVLKSELNLRRPLYYSASTADQSGHAFVVDGYDEDDKFHVNWGWGGSSNGFYTISDNNQSDMLGFIYNADIGRNVYPVTDAPAPCTGFQRNNASSGSIMSNTPTETYAANSDCQWLLAAPEVSKYIIHFDRFETEQDADLVTIYNGSSPTSGVLAQFCGTTIPGDVTVIADSVLITFTSDAQNEFGGFQISYTTQGAAPYCTDQNITSTGSTIITDGSGDDKYRNNTVCNWNISTPNMSHCYFSFPQLEFGYGDFVEIYNNATTPATLLYRFDLLNYPAQDVIDCRYSKLKVRFVADNWDTGNGFTMTVEPVVGVNNYAGITEMNVYPNPASDVLNVNFVSDKTQSIRCTLMDVNGKVILDQTYSHNGGLFEEKMDIHTLSKGIYFLQIITEDGCSTQKVSKM